MTETPGPSGANLEDVYIDKIAYSEALARARAEHDATMRQDAKVSVGQELIMVHARGFSSDPGKLLADSVLAGMTFEESVLILRASISMSPKGRKFFESSEQYQALGRILDNLPRR